MNELYTNHQSSFKNVTLSTLISEITKSEICKGVSHKTDAIMSHVVSKTFHEKSTLIPMEKIEQVFVHLCSWADLAGLKFDELVRYP